MKFTDILIIIINFAGALAIFLFAMKMMSEGLQKVAGSKMRSILGKITDRPLRGILTGTAVTAAIQSSSATTVMVVSFVNAGLLSLAGAVAVIMGANIGTTATAWLIMLLGLGEGDGSLSLPTVIAAISLAFLFAKRDNLRHISQIILGLCLILVGMELLQAAMPDLENYPKILAGIAALSNHGFWSVMLIIAIGALLTCLVQSSSAMMAITLVMCYKGMIGFDIAVALVMGQNIGTTITANIAATMANTAGKKAAVAHLLFNVIGVIITLILFRPLLNLIAGITTALSGCSPYADPAMEGYNSESVPLAISLFHTIFNVGNTLILVWFIPQIVRTVNYLLDRKANSKQTPVPDYHLTYISGGPVSTAELNLQSAKRELQLFSKQVIRMYALIPELRTARNEKEFNNVVQRISDYESLTDRMDKEITNFLTAVGSGGVSQHTSQRIGSMMRISDNLESIGDIIYQIAMTRKNKRRDAVHFSDHLNANLSQMNSAVENALLIMDSNLSDYDHADFASAHEAENAVNSLRDRLRVEHINALKTMKYDYAIGNAYSSLYAQYEKLADHIINVTEALQ